MTKKEKKEIIQKLIADIVKAIDIDEYAEKRSRLFKEVIEAGYQDSVLPTIINAANEWCKDFDDNMRAKLANKPLPKDNNFIALSSVGLLTLIDISHLPD